MKSIYLGATIALTLALAATAQAAAVIDQSSLISLTGADLAASSVQSNPAGPTRLQSQNLTVGLTGKLTEVDFQLLHLSGTADLTVTVARGIVGMPGYAVLGTFQILNADVPQAADIAAGGLLSVDVSSLNAIVHAGEVLSLGITSDTSAFGNSSFGWVFGEIDADGNTFNITDYAAGYNQISQDGGATWMASGVDRTFRTWVDTSFVPEPASWAMMIAGFGLVGGVLRRQRGMAYDR